MSDDEQPVVARATTTRTSQACQRCRSLKTRCLPSSQSGTCRRCLTAERDCVWAETPRRTRKLRAPSRISQVEQKIDGLVASLVNPSTAPPVTHVTPGPASVSSLMGGDFAPQANQDRRPVAPGTWLPFPSSFEPRPESSPKSTEQVEGEDATDRQYIEQIRSIHSFADRDDVASHPDTLFQPSKRREDPVEHALINSLLNTGEAEKLLYEYRAMSISFPFVPLSSDITARQLHHDAPMLFLAIITAASWREHQRQMSLDAIYRQELANRTIMKPRKNLSLVQSVLVYLSWYHFVFSHKTQQIFFLHHLVVGLALDIGLHRDFQPVFFATGKRKQGSQVDPQKKRERQRAFLGCYYLASMVSAGLQKPNLLKHNSDMTEWAKELKRSGEYETDEMLEHLVSLRQLDDEVQDTLYTGAAADVPLTDARALMHVRFLETQLDAWKRGSEKVADQRTLVLSHAYTDMVLHSVALRLPPKSTHPNTLDGRHVKSFFLALEAAKRFFDALLLCPASDYHLISFSEWMRLPAVMMTVAKLCIPTDAYAAAGWDVKAAQDLVRLEMCLEALCYRFQNQTTYDKVEQPHPDFWWAMRFVTDLTRGWYIRKINSQRQDDISSWPTPSDSAANASTCSGSGAVLPVPMQDRLADFASTDSNNMDTEFIAGGDGEVDPFAFMKSADFDMEQFFDMGIWSDEAYNGMGFGGGGMSL